MELNEIVANIILIAFYLFVISPAIGDTIMGGYNSYSDSLKMGIAMNLFIGLFAGILSAVLWAVFTVWPS